VKNEATRKEKGKETPKCSSDLFGIYSTQGLTIKSNGVYCIPESP